MAATQAQLNAIAAQIAAISKSVAVITPQVQALSAAKAAGMPITPQTTVAAAQRYVAAAPPVTPPLSYPLQQEVAGRVAGGQEAGAGLGAGIGAYGTGQSNYDALIKQVAGYTGGPTLEAQRGTLQAERGVPGLKTAVGSFEEELGKTQSLLSDLDARIRRGVQGEAARLAPMELITGRQAELQAQSAFERGDVLAAIDVLQRGKERAERSLEREEADILTILGLRQAEQKKPLEALQTELTLRKSIRDLTKASIPDAISSQFNDAGDLTIVLQNPDTGLITTRTIKNIGKKAEKYTNYYNETDNQGNVTFFGIDASGKPVKLGEFAGVGKAKKPAAPGVEMPYGKYSTRFKEEINNLYTGRYGTSWAREKVIDILRIEFPGQDVSRDVYNRAPDGWEANIKKTNTSGITNEDIVGD